MFVMVSKSLSCNRHDTGECVLALKRLSCYTSKTGTLFCKKIDPEQLKINDLKRYYKHWFRIYLTSLNMSARYLFNFERLDFMSSFVVPVCAG